MVLGYVLGAIVGLNVGNQVRETLDIDFRSVTSRVRWPSA